MAALIAFYSRAGENYFGGAYRRISVGNTEKVAEMLADLTGGELYKIEQAEPYSDDYKTCVAQAREDWQKNARPAVLDLPDDLDAYDEIYLGYPNYCSTMPMVVYTFLEHYDFTGKTIHPFCTHEGSGLSDTENDIRKAAHGAAVTKGLAIHGSHVDEAKSARHTQPRIRKKRRFSFIGFLSPVSFFRALSPPRGGLRRRGDRKSSAGRKSASRRGSFHACQVCSSARDS